MKEIKFTKMHGIGNDYVYIDCFKETVCEPEKLAKLMSPRHFSVGADGLILICPSNVADVKMRMFNSDGSEGKMCGNGVRCVAKYAYDTKIASSDVISVETLSGIKKIFVNAENGIAKSLTVNMGKPTFTPKDIPLIYVGENFINRPMKIGGKTYDVTALSMGNPHAVIFSKDIENIDFSKCGKDFENNPLFPEKVNTEFAEIIDNKTLKMRVYERGSGETLACGTGACAVCVAAVVNGFCKQGEEIKIKLSGGDLYITYSFDGFVYMRGPAEKIYDGVFYYEPEN